MGVIKIRYGLTILEPVLVDGIWWIKAKINPDGDKPTNKREGAGDQADNDWPVSVNSKIRVPETRYIEEVKQIEHKDNLEEITDTSLLTHTAHDYGLGGIKTDNGRILPKDYRAFMTMWSAGTIRLASGNDAAKIREALTSLYGSAVAEQIMRRSTIRANLNAHLKENGEAEIGRYAEAHHIIPIGVLRKSRALQMLVEREGWDHNAAINAIGLNNDFHGYHNHYNAYVLRLVRNAELWFNRSPNATPIDFKNWVINNLIPLLLDVIAKAEVAWQKNNDENMNQYFRSASVVPR